MIVFKKDTKGKIRFLEVTANGSKVIQKSGIVGSENIVEHSYEAVPKNIGRTNETTAEEQANLEAVAIINNKRSKGYFGTIEAAQEAEVILPMLATPYEKVVNKIEFPCYGQPKLDGMRALFDTSDISFTSRQGKDISTLAHISTIFKEDKEIDYQIDGELYAHGMTFQEVMSLIKKPKPGSEKIQFWVYDIVMPNEPFDERYEYLKGLKFNEHVKLVHTRLLNTVEEVEAFHKENISKGYEGTIIRWGDTGYEINKRSKSLLKRKDFIDLACKIVDVIPSDKNPEQGIISCAMNSGATFNCGMKFSHEERENILRNKQNYIGRTAEIRFFEYTDDGLPRFPVCVGFRLDK